MFIWWGEATDEPAREDARPTALNYQPLCTGGTPALPLSNSPSSSICFR